jgi:2-deoxy-D-gluconate 3-dehydrogenase
VEAKWFNPFPLLKGRRALVTGGSRGIGAGMAEGLARVGAEVVITQTRPPAEHTPAWVEAVRAEGFSVTVIQGVFEQPESLYDWAEHVWVEHGPFDILVNNAGIMRRGPVDTFRWEDWKTVIDVNLHAVFVLTQAIGRKMVERGYGKIINTASLMSFQGGIRVPAYAAAKGGVAQLTKAFANEWAGRGVNVNAIAPGYIATDLTQALRDDPERFRELSSRIPQGRWGTPDDLAGAVVFLASPWSDYVNGHVLAVDGGWLAR